MAKSYLQSAEESSAFLNPVPLEGDKDKKGERNGIVAIKALSNKICRASYYIMRDQVSFDEAMLFK